MIKAARDLSISGRSMQYCFSVGCRASYIIDDVVELPAYMRDNVLNFSAVVKAFG